MPDPSSAILDPFTEAPTLSLICEIVDPITHEPYAKDPRRVAKRAEQYLRATNIADTCYVGPECEFFVLDSVSYALADHQAHYAIDSAEGHWNSGQPGLGYTVRQKEGYFPPAPHDTLHDLRTRMVLTLERLGIPCEFHHHEVASGGQCEIDLRFQSLLRMADQVMTYKYVVKNVARAAGKTATFMPKPLFGDNGSGMHTHQSLWKEATPLMADKSGYAGLSQLARCYVGGLLAHAPALLAFCAPTTNSYRRLVPGYEAPVNLVYSQRNRSACIRIPMYSESPKAKRVEFRCPDAAANPYLAFSAMLMAGLDGIERGLDPGKPADFDLFEEDDGRAAGAGLARRGARRARGRPRVPDPGRRLLGGADRDLDRVQARERGGRDPTPAAPGRVRPLLRLLAMQKVEAVVIRERVETVIDAVEEQTGHVGVTVVEAVGHGRERGITHEYRGRVFESRFLPKALLTFVVEDSAVRAVVEAIATPPAAATSPGTASSGRPPLQTSPTTERGGSRRPPPPLPRSAVGYRDEPGCALFLNVPRSKTSSSPSTPSGWSSPPSWSCSCRPGSPSSRPG